MHLPIGVRSGLQGSERSLSTVLRSNILQFAKFVFWTFVLLLHWEWYLLFSFFKEFHNDEFGCLHGFKVTQIGPKLNS